MKFFLKPTPPAKLEVDVLLIFVAKENPFSELIPLGEELVGLLKEAGQREGFLGEEKETLTLSTRGLISPYKIILVGSPSEEKFDIYRLEKTIALGVKEALKSKPAKIAFLFPSFWQNKLATSPLYQWGGLAVCLASYRFLRYKGEEERKKIREIEEVIFSLSPGKIASGEEGLNRGSIFAQGVNFARDLVNEPAQVTTPSFLAKTALELGKESEGKVKVKIWEKEKIKKMGMEAFLGVAQGSSESPKFIRLHFHPSRARKKIVLVGKGITFDTGGLSLKTSEQMETMKLDMAGAAAVLGIFKVLPLLPVSVEVVGLIPACENMPSGKALHPGDILKTVSGKTIEVVNTDAEGRLTLADALSYAVKEEKPQQIIDLATLTGACRIALGEEIAGLWSNQEELASNLVKAAQESGERVWRMPLEEEYRELLKSSLADLANVQKGRWGGAITAALFLSEFVGKTPWAHLDIAGPAFAEKDLPLTPAGGTGFSVRMLLHYLLNF